jgi:hypothetical protein
MGSDPFENIELIKSRFVSSVLTAAFLFWKNEFKRRDPYYVPNRNMVREQTRDVGQ